MSIEATSQPSTYAYDDVGNRITSTDRGGDTVTYEHNDATMLTSINTSGQTYDDAGNLTRTSGIYGAKYTLVYDHHNRLTEVKDEPGTTRLAKFTWDAPGRRIEYTDDTTSTTTQYYYDGVNAVYEYNDSGDPLRYYVHGVSYIDERLAMVNCYETTSATDDRPYYYVLDRMYNVRALVDRAGSIVERYCYDPYGKPLIRESLGRGDQRGQDTILALGDATAFAATTATPPTMWDPRADMDDDGDIDATDVTLKSAKAANWPNPGSEPTVSQAFSDVGNRYMFQGVPHFAIDTSSSDTTVKFPLNHHRARFAEPVTGRWMTRDPLGYGPRNNVKMPFENANRNRLYWEARLMALGKILGSRITNGWLIDDRVKLYSYLDCSPSVVQDPAGTCSIRFTEGECWLGYCHIGINVEDDNGNTTQIDGGSRSNPGGPGTPCCDDTLDVFIQKNTPPDNETLDPPIVGDQSYCDCILNAARRWNGTRHCYAALLGPNSNSVPGCILKACHPLGLPADPPEDEWGWDDLYDHSTDHCTDPNNLPN